MNKHESMQALEKVPEEDWPQFEVQFYRDNGALLQTVKVKTLSWQNAVNVAIKKYPELYKQCGAVEYFRPVK